MRRVAQIFVALLLSAALGGLVVTAAANSVAGSSERLKHSLEQSNLYENLSGILADTAVAAAEHETGLPANQPEIREAAAQTFTPQMLRSSVEEFLDGTYSWLEGKTAEPDFQIDLRDEKNAFAATLGRLAAERVGGLRPCTLQELQQLQGTAPETTALNLECRPPGLNLEQVEQEATQAVLANEQFLPDPVITIDSLQGNSDSPELSEQIDSVPAAFQGAQLVPWVLLAVSAVLAGVLVLLHAHKRGALLSIGIVLLITGLLVSLFQLLFRNIRLPSEDIGQDAETQIWNPAIQGVAQSLGEAYASGLLRYAIILIVLGILLIISYMLLKRKANWSGAKHKA